MFAFTKYTPYLALTDESVQMIFEKNDHVITAPHHISLQAGEKNRKHAEGKTNWPLRSARPETRVHCPQSFKAMNDFCSFNSYGYFDCFYLLAVWCSAALWTTGIHRGSSRYQCSSYGSKWETVTREYMEIFGEYKLHMGKRAKYCLLENGNCWAIHGQNIDKQAAAKFERK